MGDPPNSRLEDNQPTTNDKSDSHDDGSSSKSYYYDDSTGYEIYDEEAETEEDVDDPDRQSRP